MYTLISLCFCADVLSFDVLPTSAPLSTQLECNSENKEEPSVNFEDVFLKHLRKPGNSHQQAFDKAYKEVQHAFLSPKTIGKSTFYFQRNILDANTPNRKNNPNRLKKGKNPVGPNGISLELHHLNQQAEDIIVCITSKFHREHKKLLHKNVGGTNAKPSEINRKKFAINKQKAFKKILQQAAV